MKAERDIRPYTNLSKITHLFSRLIFWRMFLLLTIVFSGGILEAVALKRVLVMDFRNMEGDANYAYLEPSITDAVVLALQQEFVFKNFKQADWRALAKRNFILPESFHTKSAGLQLGLLGRQDVVIGGYFVVKADKVITKVHILGIKDKKVLKKFTVEGFSDSRIFDSINQLSKRIAKEAKDILPNEEEWSQTAVQGENQFTLSIAISPLATPSTSSRVLPSGQFSIGINDFPLSFRADLDYQRFNLFVKKLLVFGNLGLGFANRGVPANGHDPALSNVSLSSQFYQASLGGGYQVFGFRSLYINLRQGFGLILANITVDFTTLTNLPTSSAGDVDVTTKEQTLTGFLTHSDLILGYQLLPYLTTELKIQYQQIFFSGSSSGNLFVNLGAGYKF